jgi:hypothetical protein
MNWKGGGRIRSSPFYGTIPEFSRRKKSTKKNDQAMIMTQEILTMKRVSIYSGTSHIQWTKLGS